MCARACLCCVVCVHRRAWLMANPNSDPDSQPNSDPDSQPNSDPDSHPNSDPDSHPWSYLRNASGPNPQHTHTTTNNDEQQQRRRTTRVLQQQRTTPTTTTTTTLATTTTTTTTITSKHRRQRPEQSGRQGACRLCGGHSVQPAGKNITRRFLMEHRKSRSTGKQVCPHPVSKDCAHMIVKRL